MRFSGKIKRKTLLVTGTISLLYWIVPVIQYHHFDSLDIHWIFSLSEIYLFMVMIEKQPIPILILLGFLLLTWLVLYKLMIVFIMVKSKKE